MRFVKNLVLLILFSFFLNVSSAVVFAQVKGFHNSFTDVLRKYVDEKGIVDYRGLKADKNDLDNYLRSIAAITNADYSQMNEQQKIALWINAYNAYTLSIIIDHYPIKSRLFKGLIYPKNSIRQIDGVWDKLTVKVMGKVMTLNHIEHEILRKKFSEPRIHMALVCAAMGCPPLRNEAYTGDSLEVQLNDQSRRFLSNPLKFKIDKNRGKVFLSSIFQWFGEDFVSYSESTEGITGKTPEEQGVLNFIAAYLKDDEKIYLRNKSYKIEYLDYNWRLNERK